MATTIESSGLSLEQRDKLTQLLLLSVQVTDKNGEARTATVGRDMAYRLVTGGKYPSRGLKPHKDLQEAIAEILEVEDFEDLVEATEGKGSVKLSQQTSREWKRLFGKSGDSFLSRLCEALEAKATREKVDASVVLAEVINKL